MTKKHLKFHYFFNSEFANTIENMDRTEVKAWVLGAGGGWAEQQEAGAGGQHRRLGNVVK